MPKIIDYYMIMRESVNILPFLGVELCGLDLPAILNSKNEINSLLQYYNQYHLLVIRNQKLTENQLIHISQVFGEPVPALVPTYRLEEYPLITRHTNVKDENKLPTGVVAPELVYHSDSYFALNPSKATLLYSLKSPSHGGETYFADMCFAYDTLDESVKNIITNKKAIYKNAYINQPPVAHPLVRTHAITKRKALFVNIHRALGIENVDLQEAMQLLGRLYAHATNPSYVYKHKWCDGDLLIWNNPTTMHCATAIDDAEKRLLYRILTKGELPIT